MIARITSAGVRALLVALLVALPSLLIPFVDADTSQLSLIIGIVAGAFVFWEYYVEAPSAIEFRDAAPFNRIRFLALLMIVVMLSLVMKGQILPSPITNFVTALGLFLGNTVDFPFSPVRLTVLMLPAHAPEQLVSNVRTSASLAYLTSLLAIAVFFIAVRLLKWPARKGAFNVWLNLPMFDPTVGGDVVSRLRRDAHTNIALGFLLPFCIPALIKAASDLISLNALEHPQTLVWTMSLWAIFPASMIMRGMAIGKVATMIEEKRRRAYARDREDGLLAA